MRAPVARRRVSPAPPPLGRACSRCGKEGSEPVSGRLSVPPRAPRDVSSPTPGRRAGIPEAEVARGAAAAAYAPEGPAVRAAPGVCSLGCACAAALARRRERAERARVGGGCLLPTSPLLFRSVFFFTPPTHPFFFCPYVCFPEGRLPASGRSTPSAEGHFRCAAARLPRGRPLECVARTCPRAAP